LTKAATTNGAGHEDNDTEHPYKTELASCPETTDAVSKDESQEGTSNRADLNHSPKATISIGMVFVPWH
jgi:hypothetical protein